MLNEEVRKIMTIDPVVVTPDTKISEVSEIMTAKRVQQIPVVENGKLIGLATSYDLWKKTIQDREDSRPIKDIMTTNIIKIAPKDKVGTAAELFMDKRFKTLPVVNLDNTLKGVVTAFDVIKHVMTREYQ
ncbi:MAG: CBS domain-containing protein, partial [Bacteroidia bacterium]|nr:CBS domain-containing protein [Bacteroidia bacterium]